MAEARQRAEWDRTSALCAMIHNSAMGCEKAMSPAEFNPFTKRIVAKPITLPLKTILMMIKPK